MQTNYIKMLYKAGLTTKDIDLLIRLKKNQKTNMSFNKEA